jgi:hypothetical protein
VTATLQIAYLPTLYSAFNRRENEVALLNARAGTPSWGPELLARTHYGLSRRPLSRRRGDYLPAATAFSSARDSRMSCGRSGPPPSPTQRSNATLKTAIPASAVRLAAGSRTPR